MLAATQYKFRHDQVAKYIHWCILRNLKAKIPENWTKHEPEKIYTNEEVTVMWDMAIETDKHVKLTPRTLPYTRKNSDNAHL